MHESPATELLNGILKLPLAQWHQIGQRDATNLIATNVHVETRHYGIVPADYNTSVAGEARLGHRSAQGYLTARMEEQMCEEPGSMSVGKGVFANKTREDLFGRVGLLITRTREDEVVQLVTTSVAFKAHDRTEL